MKMISECSHKFEPRYDEVYENPLDKVIDLQKEAIMQGRWGGTIQGSFPPYLKSKTYICDVCVYCGKVVERSSTGDKT
jgi:hypothetical protein